MKATISEALNKGIDAQKQGRISEAEQIYLAILTKFPSHPDASHNLGVLVSSKGDEQKALIYFKRSIAVNPNVKQFWLSYLNALITLGRIIEAKQVFKLAENKGITNDPFLKIRAALGLTDQKAQIFSKTAFNGPELSTKKVAAKARVHKDTLLRWLRNGSIPEPKRDHRGWRKFSYAEAEAVISFAQMGSSPAISPIDEEIKQEGKWMSL